MKKYELAIVKRYKSDNQNLFKSIKTAYNRRVASKIEVADWQLKVMVLGTEPIRPFRAISRLFVYCVCKKGKGSSYSTASRLRFKPGPFCA